MAGLTIQQAFDLALQHHQAGRLRDAEQIYRQVLTRQPAHAGALHYLGLIAHQMGRHEVAVDLIRQAIALRPGDAEAHYNLGNALRVDGKLDEAIASYGNAIALRPGFTEAHHNLGSALEAKGQPDEAMAAYRQAITLRPGYAEAHYNLGNALMGKGQLEEAITAYRQAIAMRPGYAEAHNNLGNALKDKGQLDEAITAYRQASCLEPANAKFGSNLVYALHFHSASDVQSIAEEHRRWNRQHAEPLQRVMRPLTNDSDPHRRLKIGYVSPDFRIQAEAYFVVPLLRAHDHDQLEVHCYSSVALPDLITARIKGCTDVWHDVVGVSDAQLADRIREDRIDVLVDLTMHMANNRMLTFARRPAPVQVAWLAYPGGTGLNTMDYRLTDAVMDPTGKDDAFYVEKSVRLPDCWCCYDPLCEPLALGPPPVLNRGHITFGSLNNFCKINRSVLILWAQVLCAVPDSRLLLLAGEGDHRRQTREFLEARGIAPERVEFQMVCPRLQYLRLYDRIDIALDPFPYNGITTTCDAVWMGVPVVTLAGETPASRAGLGLLTTAGLGELAGTTTEQFVRIAVELAGDIPRLQQLRSTLRRRMEQSPLMDAPKFAGNIEAAYRQMWRNWCQIQKG